MNLRQIEVIKCNDCPFLNSVDTSDGEGLCNIETREISGDDKLTPNWCPLLEVNFIEVSHIDN